MPLNCNPQFETPTSEKFQVTHHDASAINPGGQDLECNRMNALKKFIKLKPPMFEGQSDTSAAERWLGEVTAMFDTTEVAEEYRVEFATYLFEGSAEEWWDLKGDDYHVADLNWDEFKTLFREAYAPETLKHDMIQQLGKISQRSMTVMQYHTRFVELSSCDPLMVADPALRCNRFRMGLKSTIKSKLEPFAFTELRDLVNAAQSVEAYLIQKCKDRIKRLGERDRPYGCRHCRQPGHEGRKYPLKRSAKNERIVSKSMPVKSRGQSKSLLAVGGKLGSQSSSSECGSVCYFCGEVGHLKRTCPLRPSYLPRFRRLNPLQGYGFQRAQNPTLPNVWVVDKKNPNVWGSSADSSSGNC